MERQSISRDGSEAILNVLTEFDLSDGEKRAFLKWCDDQVSVFRQRRMTGRWSAADVAWCDRSAETIRELLKQFVDSRCPGRVRFALRRDIEAVEAVAEPLRQLERQLKAFATAGRNLTPKHRPPDTDKRAFAELLGSRLIALGLPVVSTPGSPFQALAEILWREISGSDDVSLDQHIYRAVTTLKRNQPRSFRTRRLRS